MDKDSPLGVTEAFTVGLLRGPVMLARVVDRVKELLSSKDLDEQDKEALQKSLPSSSGNLESEDEDSVSENKQSQGEGDVMP